RRLGEQWLDAVRLRADAVHQAHVRAVPELVDVVSALEAAVLARSEGRRKEDAVASLDRHQVLTQNQRGGPIRTQPCIESCHVGHRKALSTGMEVPRAA